MSAVEIGGSGLPPDPQTLSLEWIRGTGETQTVEYRGERSAVLARYEQFKSEIGTRQLNYINAEGNSRLVARFVRIDIGGEFGADGVVTVEEIIGQYLVRVAHAAPLFRDLNDDQVAVVLAAVETRVKDDDIDGFGDWNATQKELRWQMLHGQDSYFDTTFILRIRKQGIRSSALQGIFEGVNTVQELPALSAQAAEVIGTLPPGEWLYKPPQTSYQGRGIWNSEREFHWSAKWSVMYGGTLKGHIA